MGTSPSKPRGTYSSYDHDRHVVRQLIKAKHLAPFYHESRLPVAMRQATAASTDECPICLLTMPVRYLNSTVCCRHVICTECFLQLRRTKVDVEVRCVYCNRDGVGVYYQGGEEEREQPHEEVRQQRPEQPASTPPPKRQSVVQDALAKFERRSPEASLPSPPSPPPPPVVTYVPPPPAPAPAETTTTTTSAVSRPHSPNILPPPSSPVITPDTTHPHVLPLLRQQHYAHMMQETRDVARRLSRHYHDGANEEWERAMLEAALRASMQEHQEVAMQHEQQQQRGQNHE